MRTGFGVRNVNASRRGAFGDVSRLDTTLDLQHAPERRIARTGGGGLVLTQDGDDVLLAATLPETRDADDTIALVRAGVLRGFSIEFSAETDEWAGDLRTVTRAGLPSDWRCGSARLRQCAGNRATARPDRSGRKPW